MGFYFSLKDANIVAYLTDHRPVSPPRFNQYSLWQFLGSLYRSDGGGLDESGRSHRGFVSSNKEYVRRVLDAAERAHRAVGALPSQPPNEFIAGVDVAQLLGELRELLSDYSLFGLTIRGSHEDNQQLNAFALNAAYSSGHRALFLITDWDDPQEPLEFLDPFPALRPLAEALGKRPGMLFWTAGGVSAYAPLREAQLLYAKLLPLIGGSEAGLSEILQQYRKTHRAKRLLHLSDLHLGTDLAAENQELLLQHLERVLPDIDRIVITGDLFDEPKRAYAIHYKNFNLALRRLSRTSPVVIPGNHDQKHFGNVMPDLREVADLEWESVVVDDNMQAVFLCFDSSRDADLARGKVTKAQKRDAAILYESKANERPDLRSYLNVALVHHHPFSFEADQESLLNRGLKLVGRSDEYFLRMEDGEEFVDWCARRDIPLILHGHKHLARHVHKHIPVDEGGRNSYREVTAVGCGTSLGAEGKPLSYNVLHWDPDVRRWGVSYFADPGDGGGFVSQKLAVSVA